jgi:hypothetical protein
LLHSISRGSGVTDRERYVIWKTTGKAFVKDIRLVADTVLRSRRSIRKRESQMPRKVQPPTTIESMEPDTVKTTEVRESPAPTADSSSPSVVSVQPTNEELPGNMKIHMRWEKAILFARTKNPNIGDVLLGDVEEMRASIPDDTIVVEYALASTSPCGVMTIVAASDGIRTAEWKEVDTTEIRRCITDVHSSMAFSQTQPGHSTRAMRVLGSGPSRSYVRPSGMQRKKSAACQDKLSNVLYDAVVTPVTPHLLGKKKLIIIPSGELAHISWAIFFDLPITMVPSLNIWSRLQTQATTSAISTPEPLISVVSNAPKDNEKGKMNLPAIRDIPYSRIEALYIARRHRKLPFIADDKAREEFKSEAAGMNILHLCAHSTFDHNTPMSSSIQLFDKPLRMSDWRELSISADLVIFSSCLSGMYSHNNCPLHAITTTQACQKPTILAVQSASHTPFSPQASKPSSAVSGPSTTQPRSFL